MHPTTRILLILKAMMIVEREDFLNSFFFFLAAIMSVGRSELNSRVNDCIKRGQVFFNEVFDMYVICKIYNNMSIRGASSRCRNLITLSERATFA